MNNKALLVIGIIVIAIAASITYIILSKNNTTSQDAAVSQTQTASTPTEETASPADTPTAVNGQYRAYDSAAVASDQGTKLLFFHASWCPQCRSLDSSIENSALPDNLTIYKVDYDANQSLRQKYGVTLQTTIVKIDNDGNKVASYVAYDEPTFAAVKKALLE